MVRYVTPAQMQAYIDQRRRAIEQYNRDVNRYNDNVRRELNDRIQKINQYNQEVARRNQRVAQQIDQHNQNVVRHNQEIARKFDQRNQEVARQINQYNHDVSRVNQENKRNVENYNERVLRNKAAFENNQRRIFEEMKKLATRTQAAPATVLQRSAYALNTTYTKLEHHYASRPHEEDETFAPSLPGRENANSLYVANLLAGEPASDPTDENKLGSTEIEGELLSISDDLDQRWRGALFALNVKNPDAARHFCTSAREIFAGILEAKASDSAVLNDDANCEKTPQGTPSRKAKIRFILKQGNTRSDELTNFVDEDINNILELFQLFNGATHGAAGKYPIQVLNALKTRIEDGILFLSQLTH